VSSPRLAPWIGLVAILALACGDPVPRSSTPSAASARSPSSGGCAAVFGDGDSDRTVRALDRDRDILVHVGRAAPEAGRSAAVIAFHGLGGTAQGFADQLDLSTKADTEGFVVVYPQGLFGEWNYPGLETRQGGEMRDLALVEAILGLLEDSGCVEMTRVALAGYSQGGGMAGHAACRYATRIEAVVMVAGEQFEPPCVPARRIPVVAFHAANDPVVAYDGGPIEGGDADHPATMPIETYMTAWGVADGCGLRPVAEELHDHITRLSWQFCFQPVVLYRLPFGGHTWPGAPYAGPDLKLDAVDVLWDLMTAKR
jgi:polyhydroxybutyrate depolymerase